MQIDTWYVKEGLSPGASLTLTSTEGSFAKGYTTWPGWFASGTTDLYLYIDSYNLSSPNGAVSESDETNNRAELHGLTVTGVNPAQVSGALPPGLPDRSLYPED